MEKIKLELIIEKGDRELWGRVIFNDNLLTETAGNVNELEEKLKALLADFEGLDPASIGFERTYDVYSLFQEFDFLKISNVAVRAGINPGLLRQYASGIKNPTEVNAKKIEKALHELAGSLAVASIYVA